MCPYPYDDQETGLGDVSFDLCSKDGPVNAVTVPIEGDEAPKGEIRPRLTGNCDAGQLTDEGWKQSYDLGESLRSRYGHVLGLGTSLDTDAVFVRSTNVKRCISTVEGVVMGMFPDTTGDYFKNLLLVTDVGKPGTAATDRGFKFVVA